MPPATSLISSHRTPYEAINSLITYLIPTILFPLQTPSSHFPRLSPSNDTDFGPLPHLRDPLRASNTLDNGTTPMLDLSSPISSSKTQIHGLHTAQGRSHASPRRKLHIMTEEGPPGPGPPAGRAEAGDAATEDHPKVILFRKAYSGANNALGAFLQASKEKSGKRLRVTEVAESPKEALSHPVKETLKRPARVIDDDYDDDDDEDDDSSTPAKDPITLIKSGTSGSGGTSTPTGAFVNGTSRPNGLHKSSDDQRKQLAQDKRAAEDAAKADFHNYFYTLEWDRAAMLEQQKVDELDRQVDAEVSGDPKNKASNATANGVQQGYLTSTNMGAHSLMLKHLLTRIDSKRSMVKAQDWQLRKLISEVRKNRSKWASEDKVGQEELYESAERVLQDLKAMTEYSGPFLNRVNKRDAPDYYNIIKHPMDIGTMMKKLKNFQYKSKKEFVDDLNLIWDNCLQYNTDPHHFLRKKALYMKKQTESLVFLIPDIVIRDRAEVEAEERRMQRLDAELDGMEDSDDDKPIMHHRGRTAGSKPSKGVKKGTSTARKGHAASEEAVDIKPLTATAMRRTDSDALMEGIVNGFSTPPPPGMLTPIGANGVIHSSHSQADASEAEGPGYSANDMVQEDSGIMDVQFKTWKQVTKKARAHAAADRHRLFINNKINPEERAILRSKAGMRRFTRQQKKQLEPEGADDAENADPGNGPTSMPGETLAEGVEAADDENILPDYYDPVSAIPEIAPRLRWEEDDEGNVINHAEECLRLVPEGIFLPPESKFGKKLNDNIKQMQDTRKISSKISVIKQMQTQVQTYQSQFPKYNPAPLHELDIKPHAVSDSGPIMAPQVCRAALQRTVGKIFYGAGFEDFQPSALDVVTDMVGDYFQRLVRTFSDYCNAPKVKGSDAEQDGDYVQRYSLEEAILHTLNENAVDLESLDFYVKDDTDRISAKLSVMNERMTTYYKEALRPAFDATAGPDGGTTSFNDGSDQFVSGDFAEEIDEDFFGLRELGLADEFGLASLRVPFHLLQNRMRNMFQNNNAVDATLSGDIMEAPQLHDPVTQDILAEEVGLIQDFFGARFDLASNEDGALIEDDDLPPKQRFPKPRLPPTGKITSPRKRPIREQQQMAKKRRKLEEGREDIMNGRPGTGYSTQDSTTQGTLNLSQGGLNGKLNAVKLEIPRSQPVVGDPEKEDEATGMMSPPDSM